MSVQDRSVHDMSTQERSLQDWSVQESVLQDWSVQDSEFQDMFALAVLDQLWPSKTWPEPPFGSEARNLSSPRFGLGAQLAAAARETVISPTPAACGLLRTRRAVRMSTPLTWSGPQSGCRARISAAV